MLLIKNVLPLSLDMVPRGNLRKSRGNLIETGVNLSVLMPQARIADRIIGNLDDPRDLGVSHVDSSLL